MIEKGVLRNVQEGGYEERPWGHFLVLYALNFLRVYKSKGPEDLVVKIISVKPGMRLSLQRHKRRGEEWHILSGKGEVILNSETRRVKPRDIITIPANTWHRVKNISKKDNLVFIEFTDGQFDEEDIERKDDDFGRVT